MLKFILSLLFILSSIPSFTQEKALNEFLADSSMQNASVSFCAADAITGNIISEYNPEKSLAPASVMKLITTAAALEILGPDYSFSTTLGYTGDLNKKSGKLDGDIVIRGGGDPSLGSPYFPDYYANFPDTWVSEIKKAGIKKVSGKVIADDSYYDYLPVPSGWIWEDIGNYYGAGVYGISVFDNTYKIHFRTGADSSDIEITAITPSQCGELYTDRLVASGSTDEGYVFSAPYNTYSWYSGSIPVNRDEFVLKASVTDPPLLLAQILAERLQNAGVPVTKDPTTLRLSQNSIPDNLHIITETVSPPLKDIIKVLNHESVNLYAEHLLKELGREEMHKGSVSAGIGVVKAFLDSAGINSKGMFIEDGSGLSPSNSINSDGLVKLLVFMRNNGKYFPDYFASLPAAGTEGTLKNFFHEEVFSGRMKAKSGSMTRVRSYAGYLKTYTGRDVAFTIIVNDFSGTSAHIVAGIEKVLEEIIKNN